MYLSRVAALDGGVAEQTPCLTLNRLCGSGLQAIVSAAQTVMLGDADIAIGGGAENMSRAPYAIPSARWGQRMGDAKIVDMMVAALHDPFQNIHMGVTAENVAAKWGITRQMQDELAVESHRRAAAATKAGHFKSQILPVTIKGRKGETVFETDEHFRDGVTLDDMAKLKPVFVKENGTVTAGNASGINDGAAAVVLMQGDEAAKRGVTPLARIVSWATAGVDPAIMCTGPIPASRKALEKAGWKVDDLDLVEANEAFAAQACAVNKDMGWDPAIVNVNGGAIALGHPLGCSGSRIVGTLLHLMKNRDARLGVAAMCIGIGQGVATVLERD